jgi:CubicO group peptidase (beta-lactamase class C family)
MFPLFTALIGLLATTPWRAQQIDEVVRRSLKAWEVPGVAVVIVTPDLVFHLSGYGDRDLGRKPVTPDTIFPLASCTKAFTTAIISSLADDGRIRWDDPVRKHLAEFHLADPAADTLVNLRDLGSHRTGVSPHDLLWYRAPWSQAEMVRRVGKLPLTRPFRTEMQYQSVMYMALGQAAEKAGGKPWEDLVRERLLDPLGMKSVTMTTTSAMRAPDRALGYRVNKDGKLIEVPWYAQPDPNPAGSINASARDLGPWLQFQLLGGKYGDRQIVSEAAMRETQSPQMVVRMSDSARTLNPETQQISYGLGWVVQDYRGHLLVMHAGMIDGFRAHLTLLPKDGFAFAILANREGTRMNLALSNTLIDLLLNLPARDWDKYLLGVQADEEEAARVQAKREERGRDPDRRPSVALEELAGEYEEPAYGVVKIKVAKDGLIWEWGSWKLPLEHYAGDTFHLQSGGSPYLEGVFLRFIIDDGKPRECRQSDLVFKRK